MIKPIDIAKKLNVSTSTLRHYEAWGIIPKVERAPNGYRLYTDEHIAYFKCIRGLLPGFGMDVTKCTLKKIIQNDLMGAILLLNKAQHNLYKERISTEKIIVTLNSQNFEMHPQSDKLLTIGKVSAKFDIPTTAIRHWERAGLICPIRNPENNYRLFSSKQIRQIIFLRSLKNSVYSLEAIREIIRALEDNNFETVKQAANNALLHYNKLCKYQLMGMHSFYDLCTIMGMFTENQYLEYSIYDQ